MQRVNQFVNLARSSSRASLLSHEARAQHRVVKDHGNPPQLHQLSSVRFLDFYQLGNKAAIEKERARITDEMNRGYFADMSEFKKHGGKGMIDSWTMPFLDAFRDAKNIQLYEVSLIDSWLLCRSPIKQLLLRTMKKSNIDANQELQKQVAYSFGDHYDFRKELKILNLLTGYIYLLDKFGKIRWQGFGLATKEEMSSLLSCTSLLLED
ncbi:hypothetical protein LINPERPRIM_LOCUS8132 [Linum perenne]